MEAQMEGDARIMEGKGETTSQRGEDRGNEVED